MDLRECIYSRRSTRNFKENEVSPAMIDQLLDAAVQAPNAVNVQPWAFVVVEDKSVMERVSAKAKELMRGDPALMKMEPGFRAMIENPEFNIFYNAPVLIVICSKPMGAHPDWDCCFAAENLMLRATEMGLATCPIGFALTALKDPAIRAELMIPDGYEAIVPLVVGYPKVQVLARLPSHFQQVYQLFFGFLRGCAFGLKAGAALYLGNVNTIRILQNVDLSRL